MKRILLRDRFHENPFYVLGVSTEATRQEIERTGQKLLGMLELGVASAKTYETPSGTVERTPERVRLALADLRDPERRLVHELWALQDAAAEASFEERDERPDTGWRSALHAVGFRASRSPR